MKIKNYIEALKTNAITAENIRSCINYFFNVSDSVSLEVTKGTIFHTASPVYFSPLWIRRHLLFKALNSVMAILNKQ